MITFEEWLVSLGANLQRCRIEQGLTQSNAAEQCRLDLKYYQDVEYGRRPITTRTLFRISTAMQVDVRDLVPSTSSSEQPASRSGRPKAVVGLGGSDVAQGGVLMDD